MKTYNLYNEGANTDLALKIIEDKNIFEILKKIDKSKNNKNLPFMCIFYKEEDSEDILLMYFDRYEILLQKNKIKPLQYKNSKVYLDDKPCDFLNFTEIIDFEYSKISEKPKLKKEDIVFDLEPIFSNGYVDIYEADTKEKAIKLGCISNPEFCISRTDSTNMFNAYKSQLDSSWYFIIDKLREDNDPLRVVVLDINDKQPNITDMDNKTNDVAEYGKDMRGYMEFLKDEYDVPTKLFKKHEMPKELAEMNKKVKNQNDDLEWFKKLSYDEKLLYMNRPQNISDEQFDLVADNDDLVKSYASRGIPLSKHQLDSLKLSIRKTYISLRTKALEVYGKYPGQYKSYEKPYFSKEVIEEYDL